MATTLNTIAAEAQQQGLKTHLTDLGTPQERLAVWRDNDDDVMLQVCPTPLGLRYVTYESDFGNVVPSHWSDTLVCRYRPGGLLRAYWWSYRRIWGWLTYRRWRGLPEALAWLDAATQQHQRDVQALLEQMGVPNG